MPLDDHPPGCEANCPVNMLVTVGQAMHGSTADPSHDDHIYMLWHISQPLAVCPPLYNFSSHTDVDAATRAPEGLRRGSWHHCLPLAVLCFPQHSVCALNPQQRAGTADARAQLPPPLVALIGSRVETPEGALQQMVVGLGPVTCMAPDSTQRPISVTAESLLLFLSNKRARWCPFCMATTAKIHKCHVSPVATAGVTSRSTPSRCRHTCRGSGATQVHFCAVQLEAVGRDDAPSAAAAVRVATLTPSGNVSRMHAGHAFTALLGSDSCALAEAALSASLAEPCGSTDVGQSEDCDAPSWKWLEVGGCSVACGGGAREWVAKCVGVTGEWMPDDACPGPVPAQPSGRPCNTQPCGVTVWQPQPWGPCTVLGVRERILECVHAGDHKKVKEQECAGLERPAQQEACTDGAADVAGRCKEGDCFRGRCGNDGVECICDDGWQGARCDARATCSGLVSDGGECCTGLRGADKQCCAADDVLDRNGACCAPDRLDICRVCGGKSTTVDLLGRCGAGVLDAGGLLCTGGLDECGVCDGTGLSCDMHARTTAAFVRFATGGADDSAGAEVLLGAATAQAQALISRRLQLEDSDTIVQSAQAGEVQRTTADGAGVAVVPMQVHVQFAALALPQQEQASASAFWFRRELDALVAEASVSLGEDTETDTDQPSEQVCPSFTCSQVQQNGNSYTAALFTSWCCKPTGFAVASLLPVMLCQMGFPWCT